MQMELWLAGRTVKILEKYWNLMKDTKWNKDAETMPAYSILEVILESQIDFRDKETMTQNILDRSVSLALEIEAYLKSTRCDLLAKCHYTGRRAALSGAARLPVLFSFLRMLLCQIPLRAPGCHSSV